MSCQLWEKCFFMKNSRDLMLYFVQYRPLFFLPSPASLKVSKSRKQLFEFTIPAKKLPKNGKKNPESSQDIFFCFWFVFFGRIENSKNYFWDLLTFKSRKWQWFLFWVPPPPTRLKLQNIVQKLCVITTLY